MDGQLPRGIPYALRSGTGSDPPPLSPGLTPRSGPSNNLNARRINIPSLVVNGIVANTTTTPNMVSSTPNQSLTGTIQVDETPSNQNKDVPEDTYLTTPICESAGTALVSLPLIADIAKVNNSKDLELYLDQLAVHIDHYGCNLNIEIDWQSRVSSTYNALLELLSPAQVKASELDNQRLLNRSSTMAAKLESHNLKWSLAIASETSLSSFNGFPSVIQANTSKTANQSIIKRLDAIEGDNFLVKTLSARLTQISERVGVLEHLPSKSIIQKLNTIEASVQSFGILSEKFIALESRLSEIETKIPSSTDYQSDKVSPDTINDLISKVTLNQESIKVLSSQIAVMQSSLRTDINNLKSNLIGHSSTKQHEQGSLEASQIAQDYQKGQGVITSYPSVHITNPMLAKTSKPIYSTAPIPSTSISSNQQTRIATWLESNQELSKLNSVNAITTPGIIIPASTEKYSSNPQQCPILPPNNLGPPINTIFNNDDMSDNQSVHSSVNSTLNLQGKLLQDQMAGLESLLSSSISNELSKHDVLDLHRNKLPAVETQSRDVQRALRDYIRSPGYSLRLGERASDCINDAIKWASKVRDLYQSKGASRKSQGNRLYDTIPIFGPNSDIDVFDFLDRFESSTEDFELDTERALLLFNKFLSPILQEETTKFKNNYDLLKRTLIHRYGDPKTIMQNLLSSVAKDRVPESSDILSSLSYLRKLQSTLERISSMMSTKGSEDVESYVYSQDFMHNLLTLVPQEAKNEYFKLMDRLNEDTICIKGKTSFKLLLNSVNEAYLLADRSCRTKAVSAPPPKAKREFNKQIKSFHTNDISNDSDDSYSTYTSAMESVAPKQTLFQKKEPKPPKSVSKIKFPCVIPNHKHSIAECREFFLKTPTERVEFRREFKYVYCPTCLQSPDLCKNGKCGNNNIPDILICNDCKTEPKGKGKVKHILPYSIFFCFSKKHTKPPNTSILEALENYIPGFQSSLLKTPIILASHFQVLATSKTAPKPKSLSRPFNPEDSPPVFNTCTGDQEEPSEVEVVNETSEDSLAVMQTLNIKGRHVLTLFDRGANQHLVEGQLAEELCFKVINEEPVAIGVVSGGNVWTSYGSYSTFLGPNSEGKYYEIVAQGMSAITSTFPRYDLAELNTETIQHSNLNTDTKLPPYIGGDRVKLLIGLKASEMEPECVFVIPNGVGIYKSQFRDVHGSKYCYGGPSKLFTAVNKRFNGSINFMTVFFTQAISQYRNSIYPSIMSKLDTGHGVCLVADAKLDYSIKSNSGHDTFPTPLTSKDFTELGKETIDETTTSSDNCPLNHCVCIATQYAYKAKVPLSKQRDYLDEDDIDDTINYRCEQCQQCKCNSSNRLKMISLNERIEQEQIKASVHVNLEKERVEVDLPFIKDPDKFLTEKHGGNDNYTQAHRVYKSQCRYPDSVKEEIRNVKQDLTDKGFLKKLSDLPPEHQAMVGNSRFKHYMPWRITRKDSTTTPVRLVVDPSMSGLNLCLAKGENKMRKINDILTRARCQKYLWSSDISKLYNRLYLKPSSYTYQLFLFHTSLDPNVPPEVYVLVRCWYGVTSSANQANYALEELSRLLKDEFPLAFLVINRDMYVDDLLSGSSTNDIVAEQIRQVSEVLKRGGFFPKFVVKSGQETADDFIRVLGYKWYTNEDFIAPGFSEINFSKKKRGMKSPNPFPVKDPSDVAKLLASSDITRRTVVSKVAELYDPIGIWEAYKIQLKLSLQLLNGTDWDHPLPQDYQEFWLSKFQEFLEIPNLKVARYIFPPDVPSDNIRLICVSDAAANAGGGCIYAGVKLPDGSYSCKLLASKSKLLKESVPRNELEAIRITAGLAYDVKHALGELVTDVIFVTDSSVALSWCHNTNKRLRLYCLNRVAEIRRLIFSVCGKTDCLPLFHIDGKLNLADFLTKPNSVSPIDLVESSEWHSGVPWMTKIQEQMPLTSYEQIQISAQQNQTITSECFPEVNLPSQVTQDVTFLALHCSGCPENSENITICKCHGMSTENPHCLDCFCVMARVYDFVWSIKHKVHQSKGVIISQLCKKCTVIDISNGIQTEYDKFLVEESKNYFFRLESNRLSQVLPPLKLKNFIFKDGIYYNKTRIVQDAKVITEALDFDLFFDGQDIKSTLPVVSSDSELFYSILMHVHHNVRKHSGTEASLRELTKIVYPLGNARKIIAAVRKHCPRCRLILRNTLELEMGNHPQS